MCLFKGVTRLCIENLLEFQKNINIYLRLNWRKTYHIYYVIGVTDLDSCRNLKVEDRVVSQTVRFTLSYIRQQGN